MKTLTLLFILIFTLSCGDDEMKKYSKLEGLRILAITADTPEINSSATVAITPYLSFTDGGDTTLDISWEACIDPGIIYGAPISCDSYPSPLDSGTTTFATNTIGSANFYTGAMSAINVSIPASAFAYLATVSSNLQFNGVDVIVIVTISDQNSSSSIKTFRRIKLTSKTSGLNTNPTIGGNIQNNGVDLSAYPSATANLTIDGLSSAEDYDYEGPDGASTLSETMLVSWFSSSGEFQFSRASENEAVKFTPSGNSGVLVGVYRDSRGGVAVIRAVFP